MALHFLSLTAISTVFQISFDYVAYFRDILRTNETMSKSIKGEN